MHGKSVCKSSARLDRKACCVADVRQGATLPPGNATSAEFHEVRTFASRHHPGVWFFRPSDTWERSENVPRS